MFISQSLIAQSEKDWQSEIDEQVWTSFWKAFENLDGTALNATYAEEVLRVNPQGVDTNNQFKARTLESFKQSKAQDVKISLDFWFDSRQTTANTSYEVGFFKITAKAGDQENISYGQFHIVVKKIKGVWKITQDWDSPYVNGKAIGEEDFKRKEPLRF